MHREGYDDLLTAAEAICHKTAFEVGDEVRAQLGGGTITGEVEEVFPDAVVVRGRRVLLNKVRPLVEVNRLETERKDQDYQDRLLRAEKENEVRAGEDAEAYSQRQKAKLNGVPLDALDRFCEYVKVLGGDVRVHYPKDRKPLADRMFADAGQENNIEPYVFGAHGGVWKMRGVQGWVRFPKPPDFDRADVPLDIPINDDGRNILIFSTALAFALIERGIVPHS